MGKRACSHVTSLHQVVCRGTLRWTSLPLKGGGGGVVVTNNILVASCFRNPDKLRWFNGSDCGKKSRLNPPPLVVEKKFFWLQTNTYINYLLCRPWKLCRWYCRWTQPPRLPSLPQHPQRGLGHFSPGKARFAMGSARGNEILSKLAEQDQRMVGCAKRSEEVWPRHLRAPSPPRNPKCPYGDQRWSSPSYRNRND